MKHRAGKTAAGWLLVAAVAGLAAAPLAVHAQAGTGTLVGAVAQCTNNNEVPLANAVVSVDGASVTARTDSNGEFTLVGLPAPRVYNVTVSGGGQTGSRSGVTVQPNQVLDIGVVDLGTVLGCGVESGDTSPIPAVAPTFTPVAAANTPTPVPTATPVPTPPAPAPAAPSDQNAAPPSDQNVAPPSDTGPEPSNVDVPPGNTDEGPPPADTSPDAGVTGLPGPDDSSSP